ncbi:type II toxin-antitoxin system RelE/ParE family toxin [Rhizobium sp. RHZ02]|uniref:type II toxin-antitoxin system RelE/ParE family toxin n=1 Tax=Rhizobium sp. RHZ02 TaxID=2769306 RepID=UPI003918E548
MKLTWSAFALSDRDAIFTYIETDNPSAAVLIDERIVDATRRLIDFPVSGRTAVPHSSSGDRPPRTSSCDADHRTPRVGSTGARDWGAI